MLPDTDLELLHSDGEAAHPAASSGGGDGGGATRTVSRMYAQEPLQSGGIGGGNGESGWRVMDAMRNPGSAAALFIATLILLTFVSAGAEDDDSAGWRATAVVFLTVGAIITRELAPIASRACSVLACAFAVDAVQAVVRAYAASHSRGASTFAPTVATASPSH